MTDVVKKKRGRPKKDIKPTPTPTPEVTKPKREQTATQKATQFQPGNKAFTDAWTMRKETRSYRKFCAGLLLSEEGKLALVTMYTHLANEGKFREFMELQTFVAQYAFGKPKEMLETEESVTELSKGTENTPPLFGFVKGHYDEAEQSDAAYQ